MKKNNKDKSSIYATVTFDEGVNYREIAETMTEIGFKMNHSSARNYVLRVMRKFADALCDSWDMPLAEAEIDRLVKSPSFQKAICEILQKFEEEEN